MNNDQMAVEHTDAVEVPETVEAEVVTDIHHEIVPEIEALGAFIGATYEIVPEIEVTPKKVRKSPTPVKVHCNTCGKEGYSQGFKVTVDDQQNRIYACRGKNAHKEVETKTSETT